MVQQTRLWDYARDVAADPDGIRHMDRDMPFEMMLLLRDAHALGDMQDVRLQPNMAPDAPGAPFRVLMQRLGELANYNGHVDPERVEAAKDSILKDHPDEVDAFRQIFDLLEGRQMGEQNRSPVRLKKITDAIALLATHARDAEEQARSKPEPDAEG